MLFKSTEPLFVSPAYVRDPKTNPCRASTDRGFKPTLGSNGLSHQLRVLIYFFFFAGFVFTLVLRLWPGVNFGTTAAAILMVSPVRGLRPSRAARAPV